MKASLLLLFNTTRSSPDPKHGGRYRSGRGRGRSAGSPRAAICTSSQCLFTCKKTRPGSRVFLHVESSKTKGVLTKTCICGHSKVKEVKSSQLR